MSWDAGEIPDQRGRQAVVTGANSGIGLETVRELSRAGAAVIMACRSVERGQTAAGDVHADVPGAELRVEELDLASLASVEAFADRLAGELDLLVNNAGVMAIPRRETEDGFETQFGVNHLGHFALTGRLLDRLTDDARIVTVSSGLHERGEIDFADLQGAAGYDPWTAYAQSKLANLLFAYELDRRLAAAGRSAASVGVHPGYADTNLQLRGPELAGSRLRRAGMRVANALFAQSAEMGALPTLYAATAPEVEGGEYYGPGGLFDMRGPPERQRSSPASHDREAARQLWERSTELTGVSYGLPTPTPE